MAVDRDNLCAFNCMESGKDRTGIITDIPARMDRLPWSRFHWLVVISLGIIWILDGLEVTIVGSLSGILAQSRTLGLSSSDIGLTATSYLTGAVLGSLFFGYLTDKLGRKKIFNVTLVLYLSATALTAFSWDLWSFAAFRFLTGAGIGGEYSAINSAIDELIPARVRGTVDLIINGSFWVGTAIGSAGSLIFLNENIFPASIGWRLGFALGAFLGLAVLVMRQFIPESPRWLITHGKIKEARVIVREIEEDVRHRMHIKELPEPAGTIEINPKFRVGIQQMAKAILRSYARRSLLGLCLMISQAFFYNGIFFTYPLVLTSFYSVAPERLGLYLLPFALGNFMGPLLMGHLFDSVGRRPMIAITYSLSGLLLIASGYLFALSMLTPVTQTLAWMVIFFIASSAASSAYLTVSEIFPVETRAIAISLFYSVGTGVGGVAAPYIFGVLVQSGLRLNIFYGYLVCGVLMIGSAIVELAIGVDAERKSLEDIALPLSAAFKPE